MIYSTEKALKDSEGKIPSDVKREIEQAIAEARQRLSAEDVTAIQQATQRLQQSASKIGEA